MTTEKFKSCVDACIKCAQECDNPSMSFISTMVSRNGNGFIVSGLLTIKGISKPVSFPFQTSVQNDDEVFTGNFRFEREDFDIGGGIAIGKTIDVRLLVKVSKSPYLLK